jgi:hypothetical protein
MQQTALIHDERVPLARLDAAARRGHVFAVLDACDAPWVPMVVEGMGVENGVSLYRGEPEEASWAVAPYLVATDPCLIGWISRFAAPEDDGWGIFLIAEAPLATLRQHLRRFLSVMGPGDQPLYFRFYDPRVLPTYLATCTREEIDAFFGPVRAFVLYHGQGSESLWLSRAFANPTFQSGARIRIKRRG